MLRRGMVPLVVVVVVGMVLAAAPPAEAKAKAGGAKPKVIMNATLPACDPAKQANMKQTRCDIAATTDPLSRGSRATVGPAKETTVKVRDVRGVKVLVDTSDPLAEERHANHRVSLEEKDPACGVALTGKTANGENASILGQLVLGRICVLHKSG